MKSASKVTTALAIGAATMISANTTATAAPVNSDSTTSGNFTNKSPLFEKAIAGKLSPAQVTEYMEQNGLDPVLDSPISEIVAMAGNPSSGVHPDHLVGNSNYVFIVKPDLRFGNANDSTQLASILNERMKHRNGLAMRDVLAELDQVVADGDSWSLTTKGGGKIFVG